MALDQEEKQERDCQGCSPRQRQGSRVPACDKQGGLLQLTTPWKNPSSLPILGQHLPPVSAHGQVAVGIRHALALV